MLAVLNESAVRDRLAEERVNMLAQPISKKLNFCFLTKFLSHPFPSSGVPVEDLLRVVIPNDSGGSGEGKGGDAWREKA